MKITLSELRQLVRNEVRNTNRLIRESSYDKSKHHVIIDNNNLEPLTRALDEMDAYEHSTWPTIEIKTLTEKNSKTVYNIPKGETLKILEKIIEIIEDRKVFYRNNGFHENILDTPVKVKFDLILINEPDRGEYNPDFDRELKDFIYKLDADPKPHIHIIFESKRRNKSNSITISELRQLVRSELKRHKSR